MSPTMSLAIKFILLFFLIKYFIEKHIPDQDSNENKNNRDQDVSISHIDYSSFFKEMIEGWQREADERYPIWTNSNNKGYLDKSFFLQGKAQAYVRQWNKWKDHPEYPYGDLRNKIGVLWPQQVGTCPEIEATNLLTYMIHGLSSG